MPKPKHIAWLSDTGKRVKSACGRSIEIWSLAPKKEADVLSSWARHFRQHYCSDADLPMLIKGTGKTASEYLRTVLFPDAKTAPGPSVRSGDFSEILIADYVEYFLGYWCPRELRYQGRWNRNVSTNGCDIVGLKFDVQGKAAMDELVVFEVKAGLAKSKANHLQDAIDDSIKDRLREAMTLNAMKQRLLTRGDKDGVAMVARFQDEVDKPFVRTSGAAAVLDNDVFAGADLATTDASQHPNAARMRLVVVRGPSLMDLVHALYERAADEA